jgi:hypothetical protein
MLFDYLIRGLFAIFGAIIILSAKNSTFMLWVGVSMIVFNVITILFDENYRKK